MRFIAVANGVVVLLAVAAGAWRPARAAAKPAQATWVPRFLTKPDGFDQTYAYGIDASGNVLGSASAGTAPDTWRERGVLWRGRSVELLPAPAGEPDFNTSPGPMSPDGRWGAGYCYPPAPVLAPWRAAIWDLRKGTCEDVHPAGVVIDGGAACDFSYIVALNDRGDAAGVLMSPLGNYRGYAWRRRGAAGGLLPLLPGTSSSMAVGVDDKGDVVGVCWGETWRACRWPVAGGVVDLHEAIVAAYPDRGIEGSRATGVSRDGRIVGAAFALDELGREIPEAVAWSDDGSARILDRGDGDSAWALFARGRFLAGQLGGTWTLGEDGQTGRCAVWDDGGLHVVSAPAPYGYLMSGPINEHGDFTATAYFGDNFFDLAAEGAQPMVFERRTR